MRERERIPPRPTPAWHNPPRNPSVRKPPPQLPTKPLVAPVTGVPNIQALLPNLATFANQLPAGMPKLPPVIEKLLAGTTGDQGGDDSRSRRRKRSGSRDRGRRRRRRSRSRDR